MWKYVVTWVIIKLVYIPCPQSEPTEDEFGRTSSLQIETMQACFRTDSINKSKEFLIKNEAINFIKRGQDKKAQGWVPLTYGDLVNFKLDSIKIKKGG